MPDLVTHLSIAYLLKTISKRWLFFLEFSIFFYFGTILPDILTRPLYILSPNVYWAVLPLHTPLPILFVCLSISYLFDERIRKGVFFTLVTGAYLHLFLDIFQKHIQPEVFLLFPFSWKSFNVGLIWPEESLYAIPFWIVIILGIKLMKRLRIKPLNKTQKKYLGENQL